MNSQFKIVALGEILWDVFPDRICFGGAPANFACAAAELGGNNVEVSLVSGVGNDKKGMLALNELEKHGVNTAWVQQPEYPTGEVQIKLNPDGSARYEFAENVAWDNLKFSDSLLDLANQADAVCFGTLGQRSKVSAAVIQEFVKNTRPDCLRVLDINLRFPFVVDDVVPPSLELANILKLNDEEVPYLSKLLGLQGGGLDLLDAIEKRCRLDLIAMTQGSAGAVLWRKGLTGSQKPDSVEVVDTVGAGDAFTASLILGLLYSRRSAGSSSLAEMQLSENSLEALAKQANGVASYVCTQPGATPKFSAELIPKSIFA